MADFYSNAHRELQARFETERLANALRDNILRTSLAPMDRKFIEKSDFFFLSTIDHNGYPTVSYKGGAPGFVLIADDRTLRFPVYDGNGMFYSTGNITDTHKVGLLFMDFEHPRRLRLHGTASIQSESEDLNSFPEALFMVEVRLETIFTNCARYIHQHERVAASEYVPKAGTDTPVPDWKRVDYLQDKLPEKDQIKAQNAGNKLTEAEYRRDFWKGLE